MVLYPFTHFKNKKTYKVKIRRNKMELKNEKIYIQTIEKRDRENNSCWYAITDNQDKRFSCFEEEVAKKLQTNVVNLCKVKYSGKYANVMSVEGYDDSLKVADVNIERKREKNLESLRILRSVALKSAAECFGGQSVNSGEVITKANAFLKWLTTTEDEGAR